MKNRCERCGKIFKVRNQRIGEAKYCDKCRKALGLPKIVPLEPRPRLDVKIYFDKEEPLDETIRMSDEEDC